MDFRFSEKEEALRKEVVEFLDRELTDEVVRTARMGVGGAAFRRFYLKLGAKGWLAPHWPREYGGLGASFMERVIITGELAYRWGPVGIVGVGMAGPTILLYGSEEQKKNYLPRIARGEIEFSLGYSETIAGSDLAALETSAVEDGDDYVVNGHKIFNMFAHYADYHWLGARTDPAAPKHKGVSLFIVDMKSLGLTVREMPGVSGMRINEVFYDNVRVPKKNLVGEKNRGFYHIATALDFERFYEMDANKSLLDSIVKHVKQAEADGHPLAADPLVRQKLADLAIEVEVGQLLAHRVAWMLNKGTVPNYESAMIKLYGTEQEQRIASAGMQIMGLFGQLAEASQGAPMEGLMEFSYLDSVHHTVARGSSEILRTVIAQRGLGLPR